MSRIAVACLAVVALTLVSSAAAAADSDLSASAQLLVAARNADAPAVSRALEGGASPNARNRLGETALLIALKQGNVTLARTMEGSAREKSCSIKERLFRA